MTTLNTLDVQNLISNLLGCEDLFGTEQESANLQALPLVQNASKTVQIAVNVFTIGGVIAILELNESKRNEAVKNLHSRINSLVPFLENTLRNEVTFHAVVYDHMRSVNTLNFAVGALSAIQSKVELLATNNTVDKAIIGEFFGCALPEYTTSDLLIALLDEIQRGHFISDLEWKNEPFMPFEKLVA